MNRLFSILGILTIAFTVSNCNKSDDSGGLPVVPLRDSKEVYTENITSIEKYLKNNYMIERNGVISFDSITSPDYKNQPTIFEDSRLKSIVVNNEDYAAFSLTDPYDRTKNDF